MNLSSIRNFKAKDALAGPVMVVKDTIKIAELKQGQYSWLVVVDNKGAALGIAHSTDLIGAAEEKHLSKMMSDKFIPVQPTASLFDLLELIKTEDKLEFFLVQFNGHIQGVIDIKILLEEIWKIALETEAKLDAVLNSVQEAVTVINDKEEVVGWNEKAQELYGIKYQDILGKKLGTFFENLVVTKAKNENKEFRDSYHQSRNNTHVLINAKPVKLEGRVIGGVSSERDITELFYLHKKLSKTDYQLRKWEKRMDEIRGDDDPFVKIVGRSKKLNMVCSMTRRVAKTSASVLVRGESGVGKELFADAIHSTSSRKDRPIVVVNCAAIPQTLFESELFGYQSGSFTGADKSGRAGKFELANKGTIFLDEIGELELNMQAKLLRVLQSKVFYRVGGQEPIKVDVRIITATNRDLEKMVAEGTFREDLYYRLNVVSLDIPPLRERREDITDLVELFMNEFCRLYGRNGLEVEQEVMALLVNYHWPGNVRQLRNVVERMVVLTEDSTVQKHHLPREIRISALESNTEEFSLPGRTERTERDLIFKALEETNGNKTEAAKKLGIPRSTLYYKLNSYKKDIQEK
ncbi:sigma 54-interacting transcriptional regulator [Metallumcola ferriviriculae]|uniref:Sigma 54-interacting transcriptional regulator n=1 Tax=Metallumcola ferriviriculae TaxID=3039180 RepID=A0AAU0UMN0_9FIRM|nr:sigma 54-interacting transcriptional regulator [Desulfitibacteraceae bacterium MK1]